MNKIKELFKKAGNKFVLAFKKPTTNQKKFYFNFIKVIVVMLIALAITFLLLIFATKEPFRALNVLLTAPFKSKYWRSEIVRASVPLIFAGVGASIMLNGGQFNLIGEGSFYLGGFVAAIVAIYSPFPFLVSFLLAILAAMLVTALFGLIPALLKAKLNINEFVVSVMLNFIMLWLGMYFLENYFIDPASGDIATKLIPESNRLSIFVNGTDLSTGIFIAVFIALLGGLFIYKTRQGYTIRAIGDNIKFSEYSGLKVASAIIIAQVIGSLIAGLGGAIEILGSVDGRFSWKDLPGYGYDGFMVAIVASNNPLLVPIVALFFGYLRTGANLMTLQTDVASELINVIQAIIIIVVAGQTFLSRFKKRFMIDNLMSLKEEEL